MVLTPMSPKKLVIFDWDGTLFDSTAIIGHSLQQACVSINRAMPTLNQAQQLIGLGFNEVIEQLVGTVTPIEKDQFMTTYRRHYFGGEEVIRFFDGVPELIAALRAQGILTAVATGKSRAGLNRILQNAQISHWFDTTRTADETASKPHPQMLHEIIEELDIPVAQAVMVGDTTYDIDMAQAIGMDTIGVLYGAHDHDTLSDSQPTRLVHHVAELNTLLLPL